MIAGMASVNPEGASVLGALLEGFHPGEGRDFRGRWTVGQHVTLQHGLLGSLPARVTKVTQSRVSIAYDVDGKQRASSMTHNQAAVKLADAEAERQLEVRARTSSSSRERALAQTELERQRGARKARPRVRESAPGVLGTLLEGPIGHIEKGAFHRWLGKKQGEPITDADIERGLKAGGHPAKMAAFAKAARKMSN